jgi:hypothetical protein
MTQPPLNVSDLLKDIRKAAVVHGFQITTFGETESFPLIGLHKKATSSDCPHLYLSSGIHGDEPAGPLALLSLLQDGFFDSEASWTICPLLNPEGLSRQIRENASGIDLNREYRNPVENETIKHKIFLESCGQFNLTLCLHEDWESTGFYLYELAPKDQWPLGPKITKAVSLTDPIESAQTIDGFTAENGIISPKGNPEERELWPEAIYLISQHTTRSCTFESPSSLSLDKRIRILETACKTAYEFIKDSMS